MFNKKGLSGVITMVLLIGLTVVAVAIVGVVVRNMINNQVESSESCFGNFNKVTINSLYTCYNNTDSTNKLLFSIKIGDIDVDEVLVAISSAGATSSLRIKNESSTITDVTNYPDGVEGENVKLPDKNGGLTYIYDLSASPGKPDRIEIAPIINGKQCGTSDSLSSIDIC